MSIRPDVVTMIRELTSPSTHTERIQQPHTNSDGSITWLTSAHTTSNPSLLDQLSQAVEQSSSTENGQRPGFTSKPPARIEAIDAYNRIDKEARIWLAHIGEDNRRDTPGCLLKLNGALPKHEACGQAPKLKHDDDCCTRHAIERSVATWYTSARVFAGRDKPPFCPDNTCPLCGKRNSLRIRIIELEGELATGACNNCHETWTPDEIGLLADHIRFENLEEAEEPA